MTGQEVVKFAGKNEEKKNERWEEAGNNADKLRNIPAIWLA